MSEKQSPYEMACAFHEVFNPQQPEQPTAFSPELASRRAEFKVEELVEFLYSAADNDQVLFLTIGQRIKKILSIKQSRKSWRKANQYLIL